MVLEIKKRRAVFITKQIWFADYPYDVRGVDRIIFRDCKNKIDVPGFGCEKFTTLVIDLSQDLEAIWKNMSKSSCRYEIRRAEREGIKIIINQKFEDFIKIYKLFIKTKKLKKSNVTVQFLKKYGILFIAELNGKIMGGQFYLKDKNNMRLLLAPSKRLNVDEKNSILVGSGNRLMIWEAIKYAKEKGIKEFDFGGYAEKSNDKQKMNVSLFKKSFGGKLAIHYIYQKDYSKIYKFLSALKQKFCLWLKK